MLNFDYAHTNAIKTLIDTHDATIINESYQAHVSMQIAVPIEQKDPFCTAITDLTAGTIDIQSDDS